MDFKTQIEDQEISVVDGAETLGHLFKIEYSEWLFHQEENGLLDAKQLELIAEKIKELSK